MSRTGSKLYKKFKKFYKRVVTNVVTGGSRGSRGGATVVDWAAALVVGGLDILFSRGRSYSLHSFNRVWGVACGHGFVVGCD
jgi:hypothetical protein